MSNVKLTPLFLLFVVPSPRVKYMQSSKYSNKVLVGPWLYDRINSTEHPQEIYKFATTYQTDFTAQPNNKHDDSIIWDQILDTESSRVFIQDETQAPPNYFDNYSTSYDLSYNHFPKCCPNQIPRIWRMIRKVQEPTDHYLPSYGNITNYGLLEAKKQDWKYDSSDPRITDATIYQCEFEAPINDNYNFKRFVVPRKNYNLLTKEEVENFRKKTNDRIIVESTLLCARKEKFCNPITWECSPDMETKHKLYDT